MKSIVWIFLLSCPAWLSCSSGPKPIDYGKDECVFCKMTIMDKRFGCQIMNAKGKHYNFDDLSCMTGYLQTGVIAEEEIGALYVPDYLEGNPLLPAKTLYYVASENLRSPMAGNVAGFSNKDSAQLYSNTLPGTMVTWDKIIKVSE